MKKSKLVFLSFFLPATMLLMTLLLFNGCSTKTTDDTPVNYQINDLLTTLDSAVWQVSDGWSNGAPFLSGWCADSVMNDESGLSISLEDRLCSGEVYASGEYRTAELVGHGRIEVEMIAAKGAGIVSSVFFYTGESDGNAHEEIDIEILGSDTSRMQVNYWTEESGIEQEHPTFLDLGFDASLDYHLYAIEWRDDSILWFVDNILVHSEAGSKGKLPVLDMRIFMNVWACSASVWCGVFDDTLLPKSAKYRHFKFVKF